MKLNKWLYGAAALAMLAACSDKDIAPGGGDGNTGGNNSGEAENGYLAVQINLPQQSSTRADDGGKNDNYDDGDAWEYAVDNALIMLFTGPGTSTVLNQGQANEKTVYLPTDAAQIKFHRAQELHKPFFWNAEENDNITTSYLAAIQVKKEFSGNLWAIVMLNRDDKKYVYNEEDNTVTIDGTPINTYADLQTAISTSDDDSDFMTPNKKIFMTNAPLSNVPGSTHENASETALANPYIETLAYLGTPDNLFDSMEEAKASPAACIFVERAMAKVTYGSMANGAIQLSFVQRVPRMENGVAVVDENGNTIYDDVELNSDAVTANASVQYCLTNKNKKSYVVRNINFANDEGITDNKSTHFSWALNSGEGDKFRMVGSVGMPALKTPFHKEMKNLYRTYWCKDPNYGVELDDEDKINYSVEYGTDEDGNKIITNSSFVETTNALYCKENTFTVKNQNHGNSTLAVFKVNYNITKKEAGAVGKVDGNLYIRDDNKEKIYLTPEEAMAPAFLRVFNNNKIKETLQSLAKTGVTGTYKVSDYIKVGWTVNDKQQVVWNNISLDVKDNDPYFPSVIDGKAIAQVFREKVGDYANTNSLTYEILSDINNWFDVTQYKDGISYYLVPIKHFGDWSCPWSGKGTTTSAVYKWSDDDHAGKYLGRFGMVRNNWYELNISEIKALGSAVPPEVEDELSDDFEEDKKYFAVEIHTLSWAKRTQSIKF